MGAKHFGARITRLEDPALLTGRGQFVDDVNLPGMLHAAFVRSPHAHARFRTIDGAAARAMPGVHAVFDRRRHAAAHRHRHDPDAGAQPGDQDAAHPDRAGPRRGLLRRPDRRRRGCRQPLRSPRTPPRRSRSTTSRCRRSSDARDAVKPGAPRAHSDLAANIAAFVPMSYGDVDAAFKNAPHVFEEEMELHRGAAMTLEGRAVLASYDPAGDMLTVWSSTQTPHLCRGTLADLFERNTESIRVIAPFVGGGFGTKAPFYPEEAVIPAAAMKLGRPVKWQEDRREHFLSSTQERDQYWKVAIAVDGNGKILGVPRHHAARHRRLSAVGHHRAVHRVDDVARPLCHPGLQDREHGGADQPGADHGGARRRPAAGGVRHGAADGPGRPRAEHRPRRTARAQHHPARADAVFAGADFPRRQADGLCQRRFPEEPAPRHRAFTIRRLPRAAEPRPAARAAISASASAIMSRAPGWARSRASPSASCRTARSRSRPAPPRRARAPAPRCRRSSPTGSAAGSRTS